MTRNASVVFCSVVTGSVHNIFAKLGQRSLVCMSVRVIIQLVVVCCPVSAVVTG